MSHIIQHTEYSSALWASVGPHILQPYVPHGPHVPPNIGLGRTSCTSKCAITDQLLLIRLNDYHNKRNSNDTLRLEPYDIDIHSIT